MSTVCGLVAWFVYWSGIFGNKVPGGVGGTKDLGNHPQGFRGRLGLWRRAWMVASCGIAAPRHRRAAWRWPCRISMPLVLVQVLSAIPYCANSDRKENNFPPCLPSPCTKKHPMMSKTAPSRGSRTDRSVGRSVPGRQKKNQAAAPNRITSNQKAQLNRRWRDGPLFYLHVMVEGRGGGRCGQVPGVLASWDLGQAQAGLSIRRDN